MNKYNPDASVAIPHFDAKRGHTVKLLPLSKRAIIPIENKYDKSIKTEDGAVYVRDRNGAIRNIVQKQKPVKGNHK